MEEARPTRTIRCDQCGAAIVVSKLAPQVRCPFCGHQQGMLAEQLDELAAYQSKAEGHFDDARTEHAVIRAWGRTGGREGSSPLLNTLVSMVLMVGFPLAVAVTLGALVAAGFLPKAVMWALSFLIPTMVMVGFGISMWWFFGGRRRGGGTLRAASSAVACPSCGASSELEPGQILDVCPHCGSSLLPGAEVMAEGLDAARQVAQRAELERYRAERTGMLKIQGYNLSRGVHIIVLAPFICMVLGGAAWFSFEMAVGDEPFHPGIFALWGLGLGLVGLVAGISLFRWYRVARWRSLVLRLSAPFGGQVSAGPATTVQWLNRFWPGPYDIANLAVGPCCHVAPIHLQGFPALLHVDPVPLTAQQEGRVHVLVSASFPGTLEGTGAPGSTELGRWLAERGLRVEGRAFGLLASVDSTLLHRIRARPTTLLDLRPLIPRLAELAVALGGRP